MFDSILLATDGSAHAKKATGLAVVLAETHNSALTIASVSSPAIQLDEVESSPAMKSFPEAVKEDLRQFRKNITSPAFTAHRPFNRIPAPRSALIALADAIIDDAEEIAHKHSIKTISRAPLVGDPADAILKQAEASNADLIVMGTRGLSDFRGMVIGSTSHKIMHLSKCPCLTVK